MGYSESVEVGERIHGARYGFYVKPIKIPSKESVPFLASEGFVIPRNIRVGDYEFQIQGAVDELTKEGGGYVITEVKTTRYSDVRSYRVRVGEFQLRIYGWVLSAYIPVKRLVLKYINQGSGSVIFRKDIGFDEELAEREIRGVLKALIDRDLPKPREVWKCRKCRKVVLCEKYF